MALNDRIISQKLIGKDMEGCIHGLILRIVAALLEMKVCIMKLMTTE
jgi:hypothetical protein